MEHRLGTAAKVLGNEQGQITLWTFPARGLLVTIGMGHASAELGEPFCAALDAGFEQGVREIWHDWEDVWSYDTPIRPRITEWTQARPALAKNTHVLLGSNVVAVAVRVANLVLGRVLDFSADRADFERRLLARL